MLDNIRTGSTNTISTMVGLAHNGIGKRDLFTSFSIVTVGSLRYQRVLSASSAYPLLDRPHGQIIPDTRKDGRHTRKLKSYQSLAKAQQQID